MAAPCLHLAEFAVFRGSEAAVRKVAKSGWAEVIFQGATTGVGTDFYGRGTIVYRPALRGFGVG